MKVAIVLAFVAFVAVYAATDDSAPVLDAMTKVDESTMGLTKAIETFMTSKKNVTSADQLTKIKELAVKLIKAEFTLGEDLSKLSDYLGFPAPPPESTPMPGKQ